GQEAQRFLERGSLRGLDPVDLRKNVEQLAGTPARRNVRSNIGIESEQADAVTLMVGEVAQTSRDDPRIVDLFNLARSVIHRPADVQQDENARIRLAFV